MAVYSIYTPCPSSLRSGALVTSFCAPHYFESTLVEHVETRFEQHGMMRVLVPPLANASSQHVLPPDIKEALLLLRLDCYQEFDLVNNLFPRFDAIIACSPCAGFVMPCENILPADVSSVAAFTPAHNGATDVAHWKSTGTARFECEITSVG